MKERKATPYRYHGVTHSLCRDCDRLIPAKIIEQNSSIYYQKRCPEHGAQKVLVSSDAAYWRQCRDFIKPGDRPLRYQTKIDRGCPWDCGLCPDHEQHSCVALVEITDVCNLECPVCYANSSPHRVGYRSLTEIEAMIDTVVLSEGNPDVVQISGGEPSIHPQILDVLQMAKDKPIRHLMLNTNGVRIAKDKAFVEALGAFKPGFEVYLQFDSLNDQALQEIRGAGLARIRRQALQNLEAEGLSTTLVVTVKAGVNDAAVGDIVELARGYHCVRGVTFQPVQDAGRNPDFDATRHRLDLAGIRRRLIESTDVFEEEDIVPLPCNPDHIAIGYCLRKDDTLTPITSLLPREEFVGTVPNSIAFEKYPQLKERLFDLLSLSGSPKNTADRLDRLLCCLPEFPVPEPLGYEHVFRVTIVEFLDRHNFCLGGVKRSCIHIVHPDGRIIPFDTYNMFYRGKENHV
ncbi:radical SAM protein [Gammaproteobacteria bacterium]|nr:radical SAM protein [Gammaproteobacteria bacterium]